MPLLTRVNGVRTDEIARRKIFYLSVPRSLDKWELFTYNVD